MVQPEQTDRHEKKFGNTSNIRGYLEENQPPVTKLEIPDKMACFNDPAWESLFWCWLTPITEIQWVGSSGKYYYLHVCDFFNVLSLVVLSNDHTL